MISRKKICIVTTRHISYNPRVLKEADVLSAAGYDVVVVTLNNSLPQSIFDQELMRSRPWTLRTVDARKTGSVEKLRWLGQSVKQKLYTGLAGLGLGFGIAERAAQRGFDALTRLAKRERADLYLVHHAEALGVGAAAASHNQALLGFDAEDFHRGMNGMDPRAAGLIFFLENKYLPRCVYFSAASRGIGEAYRRDYGIKDPLVLLNVFPRETIAPIQVNRPVRFYWYSQVIGPNRGLERLIEAAGRLDGLFEVHLRGTMQPGYRQEMDRLIGAAGLEGKVFFHEAILAAALIGEGSHYDVGLALEKNSSENAMICVSNKLFSYLMSGLAVIATDTDGQKDILLSFPQAGILCGMDDAETLAAAMKVYLDHPDRLAQARAAARWAAEGRFNWETEAGKLLDRMEKLLAN
jgi:glycosyltransferase involved in cell wall biosynthesis